jgi:hypothetical protein
MMYRNNLVATIKVGGKILREQNDSVAVPFGSEYSVFLKNMSTVRALVKLSIDGEEATDGTWVIIPANSSVELERFIRNGNFERGNRFKFIERSAAVEDHRGVGAEDGLVRVEYQFEKVSPPLTTNYMWYNSGNWGNGGGTPKSPRWGDGFLRSMSVSNSLYKSSGSTNSNEVVSNYMAQSRGIECNVPQETSVNTAGITVAGSESTQKFVQGEWFATEDQSHVIVLHLVGAVAGNPVKQAVTVQHKPKCTTCGRVNKATNKFCSQCGTSLQLF